MISWILDKIRGETQPKARRNFPKCREPTEVAQSNSNFGVIATGIGRIGSDSQEVGTPQNSRPIYEHVSSHLRDYDVGKLTEETENSDSIQRIIERKQELHTSSKKKIDIKSNNLKDSKIYKRNTHVRSSVRNISKGFTFPMIVLILPMASLGAHVGQYNSKDTGCTSTLSDSTPDQEGYKQIECGLFNCDTASRVVFEKTEKDTPNQWMPVFEGFNKSRFNFLTTSSRYTLVNRADFTAFRTNHILHINEPILLDQGKWRCAVYEDSTLIHVSDETEVNILIIPQDRNLTIDTIDSKLVTGQKGHFTCTIDGVFPTPEVVWKINGVGHYGNTSVHEIRENGLIFLQNVISVEFNSIGEKVLSCSLLNTKEELLIKKQITLEVKEPAFVFDPREYTQITINETSSFTLNCSGSGYKPYIVWTKDGNRIEESDKYTSTTMCNETVCRGSITSNEVHPCASDYTGLYTCVIFVAPPYKSNQSSEYVFVYVPQTHCKGKNQETKKFIIILIVISAASMLLSVGVMIRITRRQECHKTTHERHPTDQMGTLNNDNADDSQSCLQHGATEEV